MVLCNLFTESQSRALILLVLGIDSDDYVPLDRETWDPDPEGLSSMHQSFALLVWYPKGMDSHQ